MPPESVGVARVWRMRFHWDPPKAVENPRKHRVSFEEACTVFANASVLTMLDDEHSVQEDRWVSLGMSMIGRAWS